MLLIYVTAPTQSIAKELSLTLVKEKLVACINIIPSVESIYEWEGELCQTTEAILIAKTTRNRWSQLKNRIIELHPSDCPAILAFPVEEGNSAFLEWIHRCTTQ